MNKVLTSAIFVVTSAAFAQSVDCSTVKVGSFLILEYKETATFPNPSKSIYKSLDGEPINFNSCGLSVSGDTKKIVIKASSMADLLKFTGMEKLGRFAVGMVGFSGYKYPSIREGFYSYSVYVNLDPVKREVDTLNTSESSAVLSVMKDATIGYKIDNGPITPFYYEGKLTPFKFSESTKVIDFYALRRNYNNGYDRISFDIPNNTITLWTEHEFPTK